MRAIQVTCPKCGGALRVPEGSDSVTCEYCGTPSAVQRRSRVLERVMPPVRGPGVDLTHLAVQQRTGALVIVLIAVAVVIAGVVVAITLVAKKAVQTATDSAAAGTPAFPRGRTVVANPPVWEGTGGILLADIDGDGSPDVVGRSRAVQDGDLVSLVALDGKTGAPRWHTEPIGTYTDTSQGVLAIAGDTVLFSGQRAKLSAWELETGALRWSAQHPERAARFCASSDDPGVVAVIGTDDVRRLVALATGKPPGAAAPVEVEPAAPRKKAARSKPAACKPLPTDGDDSNRRLASSDYRLRRRLGWWGAYVEAAPGGARFALGRREKGTHVPQVAALDDKGDPRWTVDVPTDPLGAEEREPDLFAVSDLGPCASYELNGSGHKPRVACFAATDGTRRWDVELLDDNPLEGIRITPAALYVSMWSLLEARDPATGAVLWTYGTRPD